MKNKSSAIIEAFIAFIIVVILVVAIALSGCASVPINASIPSRVVISVDKRQVQDLKTLVDHQFTVASVQSGKSNTTNIKLTPTAPYNGFFWIGGIAVVLGVVGAATALFKAPTIGFRWSGVLMATGVAILGLTAFIKVYGALLLDLSIWALVLGAVGYWVEHNRTLVFSWLRLVWIAISSFFVSLWQHFFPKKTVNTTLLQAQEMMQTNPILEDLINKDTTTPPEAK